jgi:RHS repeat-associated protein
MLKHSCLFLVTVPTATVALPRRIDYLRPSQWHRAVALLRMLPLLALMSVAALVGGLASKPASATINPQYECSDTPDTSKSKCTAVVLTPWEYRITPVASYQTLGPFADVGTAIAAATAVSLPRVFNSGWCSLTYDHVQQDVYQVAYDYGIDIRHGDAAWYNSIGYTDDAVPCGRSWQSHADITRSRAIKCPPSIPDEYSWVVVYEAGNSATPYCACRWGSGCKVPCCERKGNPIEMTTGSKVETATDYQASGDFPLRFQRNYRSDVAYKNYFAAPNRDDFARLGIGWSATYFQRLDLLAWAGKATVLARRPNGISRTFRLIGGTYTADADEADRIVRLVDGGGNTTGWKYTTAADETELYDAGGRLLSVTSRSGLSHTINYASASDTSPSSVTDSDGRQLTFTYNSPTLIPKLSAITLPDGNQITYTYDAKENLAAVNFPDATSRLYHYELTGTQQVNELTGITDETGIRYATFTYQSGGRATGTEHAGAVEKYTFTYSWTNNPTVVDPLNTSRAYTTSVVWGARRYTGSPLLCPGCGEYKTVGYDANGNVASRTDFSNRQTIYSYDLARVLETSRTEAYGTAKARTITRQWHSTLRLPTLITEPNRTTAFTYDANGNQLTKTITDTATSLARTWTYTYDSFGRVLTADGPRTDVADVTTTTYYVCATGYQCGRIQTVTDAAGHITTYNTYNAHGQPLTITDPNGVVTTMTYDLRQRLTSKTFGSEVTSYEYWPTGLLKKVTLPDNSSLSYTYDAAHRLTQIQDGLGNKVVYTLDAMGNRTAENLYDPSNALARTHSRVFNSVNQLWKDVPAAGTAAQTTVFGYDTNGNQSTINAPLTRNTANQYDELNRLKQVTDPNSGITQYGYDANDNLTSVTDPRNLTTSYGYNGFGDRISQTSPDTGVTSQTFDSSGNVATRTDARNKTGTYSYDALNRVTQMLYSDQTQTFTYDQNTNGIGKLTNMTDASGSTAWTYTAQGRPATKTQVMGSLAKTVTYGYNGAGQLTSLTTPSGQTVTYSYGNNQITSITINGTTLLNQVVYDPFGPAKSWTWGNSTSTSRSYTQDGNVSQISGGELYGYTLDNAFRITGITNSSNSALSWTYGYDVLDRLNSAVKTSSNFGWTYDANGNRLSQTNTGASTFTIATTSNRLNATAGALTRTYTYDAAGNPTSDGTRTFGYNDVGRMISATDGGITTIYAYNALGQRVKKSSTSGTIYFVYDEAGHLISELDGSGDLVREHVWFNDIPVALLLPNGAGGVQIHYVHTDHLNTAKVITRPSDNAIVWRLDADPFGNGAPDQDPDGDATTLDYGLRFPGQIYSAETGLNYNYFRDYDPVIGRYIESDPIGLDGGINTYAYAQINPVLLTDPFGLWVTRCSRELGDRGKPATSQNNLLRHEYLNVSGQILSFQAGDNMSWSKGRIDNNEDQIKGCRTVCWDNAFDKYVLEAANEVGAPTYCLLAYPGTLPHMLGARNCQTWDDEVLAIAKEKYLSHEKCPACFK